LLSHSFFLLVFFVTLRNTPRARHRIERNKSVYRVQLLHLAAVVKKNLGAGTKSRHKTELISRKRLPICVAQRVGDPKLITFA
jgi:hypothetical protein